MERSDPDGGSAAMNALR